METLQVRLTILTQQIHKRINSNPIVSVFQDIPLSLTLQQAVEAFEKQFILRTLEQHHWNKSQTAQTLGIGRKTLYRKMQQLGLLKS